MIQKLLRLQRLITNLRVRLFFVTRYVFYKDIWSVGEIKFSLLQYQNGAIVIPKSTNKDRIKSNIDIFDFELTEEDMEIIDSLNTNNRLVRFEQAAHDKNYPFGIEFWNYAFFMSNKLK